ncbi:MAG: DUF3536 domain-containing protein [Pseudomonadota bacterium]
MNSYVCIHCHFYQPPRENPWLERIEIQDSAYPYHDWNMRINAESYGPNASARILDANGRINRILNNYEKISFNFGPTLLDWLEKNAADVYGKIIAADRLSIRTRSGHGNAVAQAYSHMIMPLANRRDKRTQVIWGIKSFRKHFGREPEGMWLPETAVNVETLEILAEQGIAFTILAPSQASHIRTRGNRKWEKTAGGTIDPRQPYLVRLPGGDSIVVFFYNAQIAHEVAFGDLLASGENLATRILSTIPPESDQPLLTHIATDGETFGHHHRFGDMALAYANVLLEKNDKVTLTNYAEYLAQHPPLHEVQIIENSSWSCVHGVERWRSNCGCNTGYNSGWNQSWRAPLRESLDWLRYNLIAVYRREAEALFFDPWTARDQYLDVVMDRSQESKNAFWEKYGRKNIGRDEEKKGWILLEMQRNAMLMFTSCGWFFDEVSGIEPVQILCYAARAMDLAGHFAGSPLEENFLVQLSGAVSNIGTMGNGADVYRKFVLPSKVSLRQVAAHAAISSFFAESQGQRGLGCFQIARQEYFRFADSEASAAAGRLEISCAVTGSTKIYLYAALQQNLHDFKCAVLSPSEISSISPNFTLAGESEVVYESIASEIGDAFKQKGVSETIKIIERNFGTPLYSIKDIFRDEQQQLLKIIIQDGITTIEMTFEEAYKKTSFLMGLLESLGHRVPATFRAAAEIALKREIITILDRKTIDVNDIDSLIREMARWDIKLESEWLDNVLLSRLSREAGLLRQDSGRAVLQRMNTFLTVLFLFPAKTNLWEVQNIYHEIMAAKYHLARERAERRDEAAQGWLEEFLLLGHKLFINVDELACNLPKENDVKIDVGVERGGA